MSADVPAQLVAHSLLKQYYQYLHDEPEKVTNMYMVGFPPGLFCFSAAIWCARCLMCISTKNIHLKLFLTPCYPHTLLQADSTAVRADHTNGPRKYVTALLVYASNF
eukprot:GDKI01024248.1.p1 GENE.GDKI01024248.1~~GDKI01024248.1.p1  ORF type:complete len:107 (-),score=9.53 GDKI01024248.1:223-543(-)